MPDAKHDEIARLLVRVNQTPPGKSLEVSLEDQARLRRYIDDRLAQADLSKRERLFCSQISAQLRGDSPPSSKSEPSRANLVLRSGIDKCDARLFGEVTSQEIALMEQTVAQLEALAEPAESHFRLKEKLVAVMAAYHAAVTQDGAAAADHPEAPAVDPPPAGHCAAPQVLLEGRELTAVHDLAGYSVDLRLRVIHHDGDLTIEGDVAEDTFIEGSGSVTVKGSVFGHIHAAGTIWVNGNVTNGYLIADAGDIFCGRASGGVRLVAPAGSIRLESAARCAVMYAGRMLRIDGEARGGRIWAGTVHLGGTLAVDECHCLSEGYAHTLESDGADAQRFLFREILSVQETGRAVNDAALGPLKEHLRLRMRLCTTEAMYGQSSADQRRLWLTMIYVAKAGAAETPSAGDLRGAHARMLYFSVLCAAGEAFLRSITVAMEVGGDAAKPLAVAAEDETRQAITFIEREGNRLPPELAAKAKEEIQSACRHLNNIAHKVKDAAVNQNPLGDAAADLRSLLQKWDAAREAARAAVQDWQPQIGAVLGDKLISPDLGDDKLAMMAARMAEEAFDPRTTKVIRALNKAAAYYAQVMADWAAGVEAARERALASSGEAAAPGVFVLSPVAPAERFVQAGGFSRGVVLGCSAAATDPFVLDKVVDEPARFACGPAGIEARAAT